MVESFRSWARHAFESAVHHWPSTLAGLAAAGGEVFYGLFDKFLEQGPSITELSGPELKSRLIKAGIIAVVGALARFGRRKEPS